MTINCPYCAIDKIRSDTQLSVIKTGSFIRRSDRKKVQRYFCKACQSNFSKATFDTCYYQKKRNLNQMVASLFSSGLSQRRLAILLSINRKTVVRKFLFMSGEIKDLFHDLNSKYPLAEEIQFDDLETFEHSKCKPLSVTLAVETKSRRILGFKVSQMPPKGLLAKISYKKYGWRKDERHLGRQGLFKEIKSLVHPYAKIESDQNPHYPSDVKKYFPGATHITFKGKRGAVTGQGELKKIRHDPLFSLNHTCAMFRANINRLFRKTWCTTKKRERLEAHLYIYAFFHNQVLI